MDRTELEAAWDADAPPRGFAGRVVAALDRSTSEHATLATPSGRRVKWGLSSLLELVSRRQRRWAFGVALLAVLGMVVCWQATPSRGLVIAKERTTVSIGAHA